MSVDPTLIRVHSAVSQDSSRATETYTEASTNPQPRTDLAGPPLHVVPYTSPPPTSVNVDEPGRVQSSDARRPHKGPRGLSRPWPVTSVDLNFPRQTMVDHPLSPNPLHSRPYRGPVFSGTRRPRREIRVGTGIFPETRTRCNFPSLMLTWNSQGEFLFAFGHSTKEPGVLRDHRIPNPTVTQRSNVTH